MKLVKHNMPFNTPTDHDWSLPQPLLASVMITAWFFLTFSNKSHNMKALIILSHSWSPFFCQPKIACLHMGVLLGPSPNSIQYNKIKQLFPLINAEPVNLGWNVYMIKVYFLQPDDVWEQYLPRLPLAYVSYLQNPCRMLYLTKKTPGPLNLVQIW